MRLPSHMETWATFSIIDHRKPIYRQALALFDRIVVPVPSQPIGNQTEAELEQLRAEVDYLADHQAAQLVEWDSASFQEWRLPFLAEATSANINRDVFHDTRLMVAEKIASTDILAVPVYGGIDQWNNAKTTLMQVEEALTVEIMQRLPVPAGDTPLENLIALRNKPAFRSALDSLLEWKRLQAPAIFLNANRAAAMSAALKDFDKLTKSYAEAMEAEGFKKAGTVGSIFLSAFTGEFFGALKEGALALREMREPCWKNLSGMKCAPGGVIYHFAEALPNISARKQE